MHKYCQTAQIIKNQRIYCEKCGAQYNLFIKEERVCSTKLIALLFKYLFFTLLLILATAAILVLDGYLKTQYALEHKEEAEALQVRIEEQASHNALFFGFVPDYTSGHFDPIFCVSWTHLTHLAMLEFIMISQCV